MVASTIPSTGELYAKVQGELKGYGNAEQQRLQQSYRAALGTAMQGLASSGLAGTTIAPSMRMGYMRQYQQALAELDQRLRQSRLSAESTFGLGGIQLDQSAQQIANQMQLGMGNLGVSRQYAGIAQQQLNLQRQQAERSYKLASRSQQATTYRPPTVSTPYPRTVDPSLLGYGR
ncbi:MAG TPA: hypothetical protein VNA25_22965 [Phycisphaerae bacterium]|nr:hypothetical protein [Phycisphaerae bacterium]